MNVKSLLTALISFSFSVSTVAQTIPTLPKEWKGKVAVTAFGTVAKTNPSHSENVGKENAAKGWNSHDVAITITIIRQEGQHLELLLKYPLGEYKLVGTLSKDSKQLMLVSRSSEHLLTLSGKNLTGCGSARGIDGSHEHWMNSFNASCYELTAVD